MKLLPPTQGCHYPDGTRARFNVPPDTQQVISGRAQVGQISRLIRAHLRPQNIGNKLNMYTWTVLAAVILSKLLWKHKFSPYKKTHKFSAALLPTFCFRTDSSLTIFEFRELTRFSRKKAATLFIPLGIRSLSRLETGSSLLLSTDQTKNNM